MPSSPLALAWLLAALPLLASAQASWNFSLSSYPAQCGSVTLSWSGGVAPHTFTFLALAGIGTNYSSWSSGGRFDITPDQDGPATADEFVVPLAEGTPLIIVASDGNGFATGGTSALYTVEASPSGDDSCVSNYDNTDYLTLVPAWNEPATTCGIMAGAFYQPSLPIIIEVVIPGGDSFVVESPFQNISGSNPDGFDPPMLYTLFWALPVPDGTDIAYLVSDAEGQLFVSGLTTVQPGNDTCLQTASYTYTPAPYAGPVETSGASGGSGGPNVGAIVGGVVGGVAGLILLAGLGVFLLHRYNRKKRQSKLKKNINLLTYPASQKPQLEAQDKEGWVKMEDTRNPFEDPTDLRLPGPAARVEQFVQA